MNGDFPPLREHRPGDEIFQHTEGAWNITAIRELIDAEPMGTFGPITMPIGRALSHYCMAKIGVNIKRARALTPSQVEDPGIVIMRGQTDENITLFMIDGHHRVVRRFRDGFLHMKVFVISDLVAENWRIKDTLMLSLTPPETSEGKTKQ